MYIDEVGDDGMKREIVQNENERYLSLTGVILESNYYKNTFCPNLYSFKSSFIPDYPDNPPGKAYCLHRKDILKKQEGFEFLRDTEVRARFDTGMLKIVDETEYKVITVVIDKYMHLETYEKAAYPPYYYCLQVITERYVRFLELEDSRGDILIESRGKKKDRDLKTAYNTFYLQGTNYIDHTRMASSLTSKEIKIKTKEKNIYGLQLADLVAHPSYQGIKNQVQENEIHENFGNKIFTILENDKYYRKNKKIWGFGKKWLP